MQFIWIEAFTVYIFAVSIINHAIYDAVKDDENGIRAMLKRFTMFKQVKMKLNDCLTKF